MSSGNLPSTPVEGARKALVEMSLNEPQPPAPLGGKACATPLPLAATGALVSSDGQVGTPEFNKCVLRAAWPWRGGAGAWTRGLRTRHLHAPDASTPHPSLRCAAAVTVAKAAAEAALIKLREKHSEPECKKREGACAQRVCC
jgi:hypothetical protein